MLRNVRFAIFVWTALLASVSCAETLYLNDGSVLQGTLAEENAEVIHLDNPLFGEVSLLNRDVLYRETDRDNLHVESFTLVDNGTWILSRIRKPVPDRKADGVTYNMMIPGTIQTLLDPNGTAVPFSHRVIGGNSLVTVGFDDLASDVTQLTIVSQRAGLIYEETSGELAFRVKLIPNREQRVKIIVCYPTTLTLRQVSPEPIFAGAGLIVWKQDLKRQQQFSPEIRFTPY
jgi:hypothetical protein